MQKAALVLAIIIVIVACLIIVLTSNDRTLNKFSNQLFNMLLPEKTTLIEKHNICGKLNGNGNGMDFLACILIETDLDIYQLKDYYENIKFENAKKNHGFSVEVHVVKVLNNELQTEYLEHGSIVFSRINDNSDFEKYFAIFIYDGGYSSIFDIRGH